MARTASTSASPSSTTALDALPSFYDALCACGFKCGNIDNGNPDHDIDHDEPSHGYLDQSCGTHRSRLPRHRHKGYHLA
jgi:hypothetical protein